MELQKNESIKLLSTFIAVHLFHYNYGTLNDQNRLYETFYLHFDKDGLFLYDPGSRQLVPNVIATIPACEQRNSAARPFRYELNVNDFGGASQPLDG